MKVIQVFASRFPASGPKSRRLRKEHRNTFRRHLFCEGLEKRIVLTNYIVDTLDDSNAADERISLREAIMAANSNAAFVDAPAGQAGPGTVDTIQFSPALSGQVITLGSLGALQITDSLQIADTNSLPIIVDGGGQQIFDVSSSASSVALSNLTLRNGAANQGGAIYVDSGTSLDLARVTLQNNRANDGGAIYNNGGSLNVLQSTLSNNTADAASGSGGAIFSASGSVTIVSSQLSFNSATRAGGGIEVIDGTVSMLRTSLVQNDVNGVAGAANPGNGGGLHVSGTATVTIANGILIGNMAASEGGGLWNQTGSTLNVFNTVIFRNHALGDDATNGGGGIFNNGGVLNVTGAATTISNNFASGTAGSGGGIFNDAGGTVNVTDATITGNVANRAGGGIEAVAGTTTNLTNVILSLNNAGVGPDAVASPGNGGGLHITGAGDATILGGEVSNNVAAREGGGLWNGAGTMTVDGTLIVGNTASGAAADDGGGGIFNNGGPLNINNATISDNIADGAAGSGGGLFSLAGSVMVTGTTFSFNSANRAGGGIEIVDGTLTLTDSNLISNDVNGGAGAAAPGNGGGLHVTGGSTMVTIDGGSVFNNLAASEGGGLWNGAGSMTVQNGTLIDSNEAFGDDLTNGGGGIFNNGGVLNVTGAATTISNNFASGTAGSGGGIFNDAGGTVNVTDATITGNVANRAGGGIEAVAGTSTNLTNVILSLNNAGVGPDAVASPGNGGGLHITGAGVVSLEQTIVSQNISANEGGGLWNSDSSTLSLSQSTIDRNSSASGGGIFNDGTSGAISIDATTISRNRALGSGGGLFSEGGVITVLNSTISSNEASMGGGVHLAGGSLDLTSTTISSNNADVAGGGLNVASGSTATTINSIFAGNTSVLDPDASGTVNSGGNNLFGNTTGLTIVGTTSGNQLNVNPLLGLLQNNGGPTETHALLTGSPAIDAGSNLVPAIDQRSTTRPQGTEFDIGAFEAAAAGGFASQWADVSGDGVVSPLDVLLVVNQLNDALRGRNAYHPSTDVNRDGIVTPIDALLVINHLNKNRESQQKVLEFDVRKNVDSFDQALSTLEIQDFLSDLKKKHSY